MPIKYCKYNISSNDTRYIKDNGVDSNIVISYNCELQLSFCKMIGYHTRNGGQYIEITEDEFDAAYMAYISSVLMETHQNDIFIIDPSFDDVFSNVLIIEQKNRFITYNNEYLHKIIITKYNGGKMDIEIIRYHTRECKSHIPIYNTIDKTKWFTEVKDVVKQINVLDTERQTYTAMFNSTTPEYVDYIMPQFNYIRCQYISPIHYGSTSPQ